MAAVGTDGGYAQRALRPDRRQPWRFFYVRRSAPNKFIHRTKVPQLGDCLWESASFAG